MSKLGFTPYAGYIVLETPKAAYPSGKIEFTREIYKKQVTEKAKELVNGVQTVALVGEGCEFVKPGDKVCMAGHAGLQEVEIETDNPDRPLLYWVARENAVLIKLD